MKLSLATTLFQVIALASSSSAAESNTFQCVDANEVDYSKDYFPDKIEPTYSQLWEMTYHNTYKIFKNKVTDTSYVLYQCGTELPDGVAEQHTDTFAVPLQDGIALSATTQVPQLEQLGLRRQITGYLGNPVYISSPCVNSLASGDDAKITAVYDDQQGFPNTAGTPKLDFIANNPDVMILKGSDTGNNTVNWNAYVENGNKATYEWHKVMGAFFNLEKLANEQFQEIGDRYDCVSDNANYLLEHSTSTSRNLRTAEKEESTVEGDSERKLSELQKPKVLWATKVWGSPYWDVARCDEENEYYCEFAAACASELLHSNDGSIANYYTPGDYHMTTEELKEFGKDADVWIIPGFIYGELSTVYSEFWGNFTDFKSVQNEQVYDVRAKGGNNWFESRVAEFGKLLDHLKFLVYEIINLTLKNILIDVVLQDFCEVVGLYDDSIVQHERQYFRKLLPVAEEPGNLGTCEDVDAQWESVASECTALNSASSMNVIASIVVSVISAFYLF